MNTTNPLRELFSGTTSTISSLTVAAMLIMSVLAGGFAGTAAATSHDFEVNVTDGSGNAVENASVNVINTTDSSVVASGQTDSNGMFTANISDGAYDVVVDHADYDQKSNTDVSHTSGSLTTVNVSLTRSTGTIESTVTNDSGNAIENASVDVIDPDTGSVVANGSTDSAGFVSLAGVPTGTYDVTASADGYSSSTNTGVSVTSGNVTVSDFNLSASTSTGTLEITAQDTDESAIANATVDVIDPDTGVIVVSGTTDSNGLATFSDLDAGTYDVEFTHSNYQNTTIPGVDVTADTTESYLATMLAPGEVVENTQFSIDTSQGTPSALYAELENGTYDLTWYKMENGSRTDLSTETVTVENGATVHEFTPSNFSDAADGDTYGVEVTFNTNDDADAAVVASGIQYDTTTSTDDGSGGAGGGAGGLSDTTIIGIVAIVLVGGGAFLATREE